jgi:hypothetical protein
MKAPEILVFILVGGCHTQIKDKEVINIKFTLERWQNLTTSFLEAQG